MGTTIPTAGRSAILVLVFCTRFAWAQTGPNFARFDFDGLAPGNLAGQDGWMAAPGHPSPVLQPGGGVNPTLAATGRHAGGLGSLTQGAVHVGGGPAGSLGIGREQFLQLDIDVQCTSDNWAVWGLGELGLGSIFSNIKLGFFFGLENQNVWIGREQTGRIAGQPIATIRPNYAPDDWYHIRCVVDLGGYKGNGSASLFIRNLTDGETSLIPVLATGNSNLLLRQSGAPVPQRWNGMAVWLLSPYSGSGALDNVGYSVVPEPRGMLAGLLCTALFAARLSCQRNAYH